MRAHFLVDEQHQDEGPLKVDAGQPPQPHVLAQYHGKKFTLNNLPWLSILKEFKLLTPNRKRTHWAECAEIPPDGILTTLSSLNKPCEWPN